MDSVLESIPGCEQVTALEPGKTKSHFPEEGMNRSAMHSLSNRIWSADVTSLHTFKAKTGYCRTSLRNNGLESLPEFGSDVKSVLVQLHCRIVWLRKREHSHQESV